MRAAESPPVSASAPALDRRRRIALALATLAWSAVAAAIAARVAGETQDDFYITFRFAENLARGAGFVFTPGERLFATTAPGWGLLLAALHALSGVAVPVLASWGSAAALVTAAALALREGLLSGAAAAAAIGGSLVVVSPFLWTHSGAEWPLALALSLAAAACLARRPAVAGLLAALATACRPDAAVALALLALLAVRRRRGAAYRFAAGAAGVLLPALGAVWLWFGRLLPETLAVKRLHAAARPETWPSGGAFYAQALAWLDGEWGRGLAAGLCLLAAAGLLLAARRRPEAPLVLGALAAAPLAVYPILGVPFYTWYLLPLFVAVPLGIAHFAAELLRVAWVRRHRTAAARLSAIAVVALLLVPFARAGERLARGWLDFSGNSRYRVYRAAGEWIASRAHASDAIAALEVGTVGFFARRPVVDLLGLVSREARPALARWDLAATVAASKPAFLLSSDRLAPLVEPLLADPRLAGRYDLAWSAQAGGERALVYRLNP